MGRETASVSVVTGDYWLRATVAIKGGRLLDVMSNFTTDFVLLQDVQVYRRADQGTCVASLGEVVIPKQQIDLLVIHDTQHESPERRLLAHVEKQATTVFVLLAEYEILGNLHLSRAGDAQSILSRELSSFFPITQPVICSAGRPPLAATAVIVNKSMVHLLSVAKGARAAASLEPVPAAARLSGAK